MAVSVQGQSSILTRQFQSTLVSDWDLLQAVLPNALPFLVPALFPNLVLQPSLDSEIIYSLYADSAIADL